MPVCIKYVIFTFCFLYFFRKVTWLLKESNGDTIKARTIVDSSTGNTARIRGSELVGDLGKTVNISINQSFS